MSESAVYPEYPCKCGTTHSGPYGLYDYGHCNCVHPLEVMVKDEMVGWEICGYCGQTLSSESGKK